MASCRASFVSILNNDDNPSFAVRSAPGASRQHSISPSNSYHSDQQLRTTFSDYSYRNGYAESSAVSPRRANRQPFDPVSEAMQPTSPGSSDCSSYDYVTHNSVSSYYHHGRQDSYVYPSSSIASAEKRLSGNSVSDPPSPPRSIGGSKDTMGVKGTRKNKYPCPFAASHGCTATFTTSGHAARHGKKHTGEKSVHCPICNKAFTRKDNMKQHIRTHRTHSEDMPARMMDRDSDGSNSNTGWSTRRASPLNNHNRSENQSQGGGNAYDSMNTMNVTTPNATHRPHRPY